MSEYNKHQLMKIRITFHPDIIARLKILAKQKGMKPSTLIRQFLIYTALGEGLDDILGRRPSHEAKAKNETIVIGLPSWLRDSIEIQADKLGYIGPTEYIRFIVYEHLRDPQW